MRPSPASISCPTPLVRLVFGPRKTWLVKSKDARKPWAASAVWGWATGPGHPPRAKGARDWAAGICQVTPSSEAPGGAIGGGDQGKGVPDRLLYSSQLGTPRDPSQPSPEHLTPASTPPGSEEATERQRQCPSGAFLPRTGPLGRPGRAPTHPRGRREPTRSAGAHSACSKKRSSGSAVNEGAKKRAGPRIKDYCRIIDGGWAKMHSSRLLLDAAAQSRSRRRRIHAPAVHNFPFRILGKGYPGIPLSPIRISPSSRFDGR